MGLTKIRCECGQMLGMVNGEYDFRCPKCKRVMTGDTKETPRKKRPARWPVKLQTR